MAFPPNHFFNWTQSNTEQLNWLVLSPGGYNSIVQFGFVKSVQFITDISEIKLKNMLPGCGGCTFRKTRLV